MWKKQQTKTLAPTRLWTRRLEKNVKKAMNKFEANFHNKGILWKRWVVKITLNDTAPLSMQYHAALILMKMEEEDEHEGQSGADFLMCL